MQSKEGYSFLYTTYSLIKYCLVSYLFDVNIKERSICIVKITKTFFMLIGGFCDLVVIPGRYKYCLSNTGTCISKLVLAIILRRCLWNYGFSTCKGSAWYCGSHLIWSFVQCGCSECLCPIFGGCSDLATVLIICLVQFHSCPYVANFLY